MKASTTDHGEPRITFLGAAREVTGSCYLVEGWGCRFIVDCGLFQGGREADLRNRLAPAFDPRGIDFVLLTHAHLDHCGLLPRLVAFGYRGPIYCTAATGDFLEPMLQDSAHLQEADAQRQTRRARAKGLRREFAPLYTVEQARQVLRLVRGMPYDQSFEPASNVSVTFSDTGHILGSAAAQVTMMQPGRSLRISFSGDVGMKGRPLVDDPKRLPACDVLLVESTYGNRNHRPIADTYTELAQALTQTHAAGGNVIVPAFSLGRTQELLIVLLRLLREHRIPALPIFIDSPLARKATEVTWNHLRLLDAESRELIAAWRTGAIPLQVHFPDTPDDSRALNRIRSGALIIAGSGMCDGGRVRHHLIHNLPRPECAVVFCGFQATGTLGRRIVDGAPRVSILGEQIAVRARRYTIGGLSSHADRDGLLEWLAEMPQPPRMTFVVHGEANTALDFAAAIRSRLGWNPVEVPLAGQTVALSPPPE